ncbi:transposase [Myxococcota bacterium]|nr:transposase [Myxococcota bacterium]
MNEFSYDKLEYHLTDSISYRAFCEIGIGDQAPTCSTLQRDLSAISAGDPGKDQSLHPQSRK